MKKLLAILLLITSTNLFGQGHTGQVPQPQFRPAPLSSTGYALYGYVRTDSGWIPANRDTAWLPKYSGTLIYWEHAGVDSAFWFFDGLKWLKQERKGAIGNIDSSLLRDKFFYNHGDGVADTVNFEGAVLSGGGGGGGGTGTLTNFTYTNSFGLTGVVTNPTTAPNLRVNLDTVKVATHFYVDSGYLSNAYRVGDSIKVATRAGNVFSVYAPAGSSYTAGNGIKANGVDGLESGVVRWADTITSKTLVVSPYNTFSIVNKGTPNNRSELNMGFGYINMKTFDAGGNFQSTVDASHQIVLISVNQIQQTAPVISLAADDIKLKRTESDSAYSPTTSSTSQYKVVMMDSATGALVTGSPSLFGGGGGGGGVSGTLGNARLVFSDNGAVKDTSILVYDRALRSVGVGITVPDASALLDLTSNNKGLLPPRLTTTQMNSVSSPATGLVVFNTTDSTLYEYRATTWQAIGALKYSSLTKGYYTIGSNPGSNPDSYNIATGQNVLQSTTSTGVRNIGIGLGNLYANTSGTRNIAIGTGQYASPGTGIYSTLGNNTTGSDNIAIGSGALANNTIGGNNVAIGVNALVYPGAGGNVGIGAQAAGGNSTRFQSSSVVIGTQAAISASGASNVYVGARAGGNITGDNNVILAAEANSYSDTSSNVFRSGYEAGRTSIRSSNQIALGAYALAQSGGLDNIGIGNSAGSSSAVNGAVAGLTNDTTIGTENVLIGSYAFSSRHSGIGNTALGYGAHGATFEGGVASYKFNGNYNTAIGNRVQRAQSAGNYNVAIGHNVNTPNTTGSNQFMLGGNGIDWLSKNTDDNWLINATGSATGNTPVTSAALEIRSTTKGFLLPRLTNTQMNSVSSPVAGLKVWNSDSLAEFNYNGSAWVKVSGSGSGGSGTVTSVALTVPGTLFSVSGSPITSSGTLAFSLLNQSAYTVFANHTSGSAAPTFAKLNVLSMSATGTPSSATYLRGDNTWATISSSTTNIYDEVPSGSVNSSNTVFTLANTPLTGKYNVFINGIKRKRTTDYSVSGTTITFTFAPTTGDDITSDYTY